jgi:hypothetical protein
MYNGDNHSAGEERPMSADQTSLGRLDQRDVETDLKAAVGARRELGGDMEDHVLEAFLARVDQRIMERVDQQVAQHGAGMVSGSGGGGAVFGGAKSGPPAIDRHERSHPGILPSSLAISIPLIAVAGGVAGWIGVVVVSILIVSIMGIYFGNQ